MAEKEKRMVCDMFFGNSSVYGRLMNHLKESGINEELLKSAHECLSNTERSERLSALRTVLLPLGFSEELINRICKARHMLDWTW